MPPPTPALRQLAILHSHVVQLPWWCLNLMLLCIHPDDFWYHLLHSVGWWSHFYCFPIYVLLSWFVTSRNSRLFCCSYPRQMERSRKSQLFLNTLTFERLCDWNTLSWSLSWLGSCTDLSPFQGPQQSLGHDTLVDLEFPRRLASFYSLQAFCWKT